MMTEVDTDFIELVRTVITEKVGDALTKGLIDIHIGFQEVDVRDTDDYSGSMIRPYVHITQVQQ